MSTQQTTSRPPSPVSNHVSQNTNPLQPGAVTAQQQPLPQQAQSAQQSHQTQQSSQSQQNAPYQNNTLTQPNTFRSSKWPTTSTWKLLAWFLGFTLTVLGFIGLKPAFVGEVLARKANDYSSIANSYANKSLSLDEWNALLAFKQYCDARLADAKTMSEDCLAAVNTTMPAPPRSSSVLGPAARHLTKRSIEVVGKVQGLVSVIGVVLLMLLEALTANFVSLILGVIVFYGGLALFDSIPRAEHLHWKEVLGRTVPRPLSGTGSEPEKIEHREDLLSPGWTTSRACYYPENPRLLDAITTGNPGLLKGICRRPGVNLDERCGPGHSTLLIQAVLLSSRVDSNLRPKITECVEILLSHGANPDIVDGSKMTALMHACENGLLDMVKVLLASHANVKKTMAPTGITPLHLACTGFITTAPRDRMLPPDETREYSSIVRCLISAGANIDARDWHGRTALHRAMCTGAEELCQVQLVCTLLELGAHAYLADENGRIPMDSAGHDAFDCPALPESLWWCLRHKAPGAEVEARLRQQRMSAKEET